MSFRRLAISASLALGVSIVSPAKAEYNGLTIEHHTTVSISSLNYDVWRVYAMFTDPGDRLVAGFGGSPPEYTPLNVETRNFNDTAPGNPFFTVGGVTTAPTQSQILSNAAAEWASFVTIGVPIADLTPEGDQTQLTPGFIPIGGNVWTADNQLWWVNPTIPDVGGSPPLQSLAGWTGDGDSQLRVMLLQLTVRAGEQVRGVINLDWFPPIGGGGGQVVVHEGFQTFNSFTVPSPTAVAALGIAALLRSPRRRLR